MNVQPLKAEKLYQSCDPSQFSFETTEDLEDIKQSLGQPRAEEALRFGTGIRGSGYNIYALGPPGTGKHSLVNQIISQQSSGDPVPADLCYVNNFEEPRKPKFLEMPAGRGESLRKDMESLVEEARTVLKSAFESEEYQSRQQSIQQELKERQQEAFNRLQEKAKERNLKILRTPMGLVFAAVRDDEVLSPEDIQKLPDNERRRIEENIEEMEKDSHRIFQNIPAWESEMREKIRTANKEISEYTLGPVLQKLEGKYEDVPEVVDYLEALKKDMVENVKEFLGGDEAQQQQKAQLAAAGASPAGGGALAQGGDSISRRYRVNLLVDRKDAKGPPIIYENNPTFQNLLGRCEHRALMGALLTDFNMIRSGALHRANGGYLILDAYKVLLQPFAWEGLKRALKAEEIKIESLEQLFSMISTVSLEPEPIPLKTKVILLGPPILYYMLSEFDPEFFELFKVAADFDVQMNRDEKSHDLYARMIGTLARKKGLQPFDRSGVARVIERGARLVGDAERLSVRTRPLSDLLCESDYFRKQNHRDVVTGEDVQQAIDARNYRSDRLKERIQEEITRGTILVDTEGSTVGQVNGLSVIQLGEFAFGRPSRITARVRLGKGEVLNIEREVALSGPIHSKGVMILSGFLGARYSAGHPLSLFATLVFEQSYSGVEGDSASSGELYALLSALSEIPIKQFLAVTGSVNQHGRVQAIGGANEKIEGFFDICKARGLTGNQGVLIPASNVKNLMVRRDVVQAVEEGAFHIYPIETIDEGIECLTGIPAGEAGPDGRFPKDTVNGKVQARLLEMAEARMKSIQIPQGGEQLS